MIFILPLIKEACTTCIMLFTLLYEDYVDSPNIIFCGVFETKTLAEEWIDSLCSFTPANFTILLASQTPIRNNFNILESKLNDKIFDDIYEFGRYKNLLVRTHNPPS